MKVLYITPFYGVIEIEVINEHIPLAYTTFLLTTLQRAQGQPLVCHSVSTITDYIRVL